MRFRILTIFPELFGPFLATSLVGRAIERGLLEVEVRNLRDFSRDRHRSVDDEPYGGGGGMVMLNRFLPGATGAPKYPLSSQ